MVEPLSHEISLMIVDDQELFRAGIRMVLQSQPDMRVVAEAADGTEAVELARALRPNVVLMDLRMPRVDGISAIRRIMEEAKSVAGPAPRIIALTTYNRDQAVVEAVRAGASGFLLKSSDPEFLLASIRTVYSGYAVIAPSAVHDLFQSITEKSQSFTPDLTVLAALSVRERDVFILAAKTMSNAEIAHSLFVSEATVKSHLRAVLIKLGLQNRLQLVAFAYEHHIMNSMANLGLDGDRALH